MRHDVAPFVTAKPDLTRWYLIGGMKHWCTLKEKVRTPCSIFSPNGIRYLAPFKILQMTQNGLFAGFLSDEKDTTILPQTYF